MPPHYRYMLKHQMGCASRRFLMAFTIDCFYGDKEFYEGNAKALHKFGVDGCGKQAEFGFDGVKLDGRGTQADMPLWDDVFRADGGPPVMEVNCQHGQGDDKDPSLSTAEMRAHLGAWVVVSSLLTLSHDVNNDTTIDQGQCESCWAFLSSGDVEDRPGPMRILLGILVVWRY